MAVFYKPDGYTSVAPYLVVNGAAKAIEFLKQVFGAEPLRVIAGDGGKLHHGEVRIDDTVVMLADAMDGWPMVPAHVHIYVSDVDAVFQRAIAAGASSVQEPTKKDDADKRGGFRDTSGITWWVGTQVE